eukprot:PhM_4_TR11086/c0_g1_i1/m.95213/K03357/APC10, DOC1; anaphase-promoting complex subunit 10
MFAQANEDVETETPNYTVGTDADLAQKERVCVEVSRTAVWSVSTAKYGNGIKEMLDGSTGTYWQSDGAQPHTIEASFPKMMRLSDLALHVDFAADESYTPRKLVVRVGTSVHDLVDVTQVELSEPQGWVFIPLPDAFSTKAYVSTSLLHLVILENHQNGRDTHIRQLKLFSPRRCGEFSTPILSSYGQLR